MAQPGRTLDRAVGQENMKRALLIAYHYPPISGSSGMQRTLKFSKYLAEFGWSCRVLTVSPVAYTATTDGQLNEIPGDVIVHRPWALDTARHLSVRGSYPGFLARPDRWRSWWFSAVPVGLAVIRKMKPDRRASRACSPGVATTSSRWPSRRPRSPA